MKICELYNAMLKEGIDERIAMCVTQMIATNLLTKTKQKDLYNPYKRNQKVIKKTKKLLNQYFDEEFIEKEFDLIMYLFVEAGWWCPPVETQKLGGKYRTFMERIKDRHPDFEQQ